MTLNWPQSQVSHSSALSSLKPSLAASKNKTARALEILNKTPGYHQDRCCLQKNQILRKKKLLRKYDLIINLAIIWWCKKSNVRLFNRHVYATKTHALSGCFYFYMEIWVGKKQEKTSLLHTLISNTGWSES